LSGYPKFDRKDRSALVYFDNIEQATKSRTFLKDSNLISKEYQVDYASLQCINAFNKKLVMRDDKNKKRFFGFTRKTTVLFNHMKNHKLSN
jgi:hypothetical protein